MGIAFFSFAENQLLHTDLRDWTRIKFETLWQMERVLNVQLLTNSPAEASVVKKQEELKDFIVNEVQKALTKFMSRKKLAV